MARARPARRRPVGHRPQGEEFGGAGGEIGQSFGIKVVPDGQVQPPELLADLELGRIHWLAVGGQDARAVQARAGRGRGEVPGHRSGTGVLEVVPDPAGVGGHQVAGPGVAVQGLAAGAMVEPRGQPGVRRGQGGGLAGREPGLRPGQERGDVAQRREQRERGGIAAEFGVQVPQHRADGGLGGPRLAGRAQVAPERHHLAVTVVDQRRDLRARRHYRDAPAGQEPDDVELALQPGGVIGADGRGARGHLGHHRRRAQVHDHVRAVGQDHRVGSVYAEVRGDLDGGRGQRFRVGHRPSMRAHVMFHTGQCVLGITAATMVECQSHRLPWIWTCGWCGTSPSSPSTGTSAGPPRPFASRSRR